MSVNQTNTLPMEPSTLVMALLGIGAILILTAFLCFVAVVVRMFQRNQPLMGIVSIITTCLAFVGFFVALIVGWMRALEWNIRGLMTTYTVSLLGGIALIAAGLTIYSMDLAEAMRADPELRARIQETRERMLQGQFEPPSQHENPREQ